jgi:hypothetical protein
MSLAIRSAKSASLGGYGARRSVAAGGIGSFLKKAVGTVARAIIPAPVTTLIGAGQSLLGSSRPAVASAFSGQLPQQAPMGAPLPGVRAAAARILPGGATGVGTGCAAGFHPNKADYFLKDGTFIAKGSVCVRNRRRNPLNPRALDRAGGRVESFGNAIKAMGFSAPSVRKIAQRGRPKRRRRK